MGNAGKCLETSVPQAGTPRDGCGREEKDMTAPARGAGETRQVSARGSLIGSWERKRTLMGNGWNLDKAWGLVKHNISTPASWFCEMHPSKARCGQGGNAEGMWELTIYLCTFYENPKWFQNRKFIRNIKTSSQRVYISGVGLGWRPKTFRLYVWLCLLCSGQADLRIKW